MVENDITKKSQNRNITIFIGSLSGGGAERVVCSLSGYLADKNDLWNVRIITMSDKEPDYYLSKKICWIPLLKESERGNFFKDNMRRWLMLKRLVKKQPTDIYVVFLPITSCMLLFMRKHIKGKIIVSERNSPQNYSKKQQILLKILAKRADGYVFQTNAIKEWYKAWINNVKTKVIPNAVNVPIVKNKDCTYFSPIIIAAGRLCKAKNFSLLIKAFAKVESQYSEHKLIIYGEGNERKNLEKLIRKLGLENKVFLPGYIQNLYEKMLEAGMFVLSSDYEGMPNVLMEAMAVGLPCIATDCDGGGAKYLVGNDAGLLVGKGNEDELAQAIRSVLSDREFAKKLGKQALHRISELQPEKIYGEWERFIMHVGKST